MRVLPLLLLVGCTTTTMEIEATGTVAGPAGDRHVTVHFAEEGQGSTAHPLGPLVTEVFAEEAISLRFDYPVDDGTGLVVYAWIDVDGDGVHCAVGVLDEPAGLVELAPPGTTPQANQTFDLTADEPCAGPEEFYPAAG